MHDSHCIRAGILILFLHALALCLMTQTPLHAQECDESCGDGCVDVGEGCDDGPGNAGAEAEEEGCNEASDTDSTRCTADCTIVSCTNQLNCSILPTADTRIEVGEEATLSHGREGDIEADAEKRAIAYLKFDLSGITGRVTTATLHLWCTDSSPDGGTVYPVRDSSWIEGTEDTGPGSGLKWVDVDSDGDGAIGDTERSRYAPDFTQPIAALPPCEEPPNAPGNWAVPVDVIITKAFQNGPGIYSLAIANDNPNSVKYASREADAPGRRPVLDLEFAYACGNLEVECGEDCEDGNFIDGDGCDSNCTTTGCGNGIVTAGEDCDDGSGNCTAPCCGNGIVEVGEACDGGGPSAQCDSDCTPAACGDGTRNVAAGEGCDDGNITDGDGCEADCSADCCSARNFPGCDASTCESCVCTVDPFCCSPSGLWDNRCVLQAGTACAGACLCGACSETGDECRVPPVADTYVEGPDGTDECSVNDCPTCGEATWDHGGRTALEVGGIAKRRIAYLKFDLRKIPRPVLEASLRLVVTPDRNPQTFPVGGDIYALPDSSWIEGRCDGVDGNCACDPGDGSCACDPGDGRCFAACMACVKVDCGDTDADAVSCVPVGACDHLEGIASSCEPKPDFQAASCTAFECLVDGVPTLCQADLLDEDAEEAITDCLDDGHDMRECTFEGLNAILQCEVCEDLMFCDGSGVLPCANQAALTFLDIDTNRNGRIDAGDSSPFLPDFTQPPLTSVGPVTSGEARTVDVTAAFTDGPSVYSLALSQTRSEEAAEYRSREDLRSDQVPLLTLTLGCTTDDECLTVASCLPRRCIDGQCIARPTGGCKVCNQQSDCDDGNPCTREFCDLEVLENGCQPGPRLRGIHSVTCALEPLSSTECQLKATTTRSGAKRQLDDKFECKLNKRLAKLCTRLVQPCMQASRAGRDPSRRKARKIITRALTTLRKFRRSVLLKAADLSGKPITKGCGRTLDERIDLARTQLESLQEAAQNSEMQANLLACADVHQGLCTPRSEVCD